MTGITFVNGRVRKRFNVNIKAIDVIYKSLSHLYFYNYILNIKFKSNLPATVK